MKTLTKSKIIVALLISASFVLLTDLTYAKEQTAMYPAVFKTSQINGTNGFAINIQHDTDSVNSYGSDISGNGDVNGDGFNDIAFGAALANNGTGQTYVVYGGKHQWPIAMNATDLNGTNGIIINGIRSEDWSGQSVSIIKDINGDDIDEIMISSKHETYVVFGSKKGLPAILNLKNLNGKNGFTINIGGLVSDAGDLNGDGINDIVIAAKSDGYEMSLCTYIIFSSATAWPKNIDVNTLDGSNGFIVKCPGKYIGINRAANLGDINGDNLDDLLLGIDSNEAVQGYVIFGSKNPWSPLFELSDLDGNNGFIIETIEGNIVNGRFISGLGDVNNDGLNDFVISTHSLLGQSHIIFGSQIWPKTINVADINGNNGFTFNSTIHFDNGYSVNGAQDINKDGINDIFIGAHSANSGSLIFGTNKSWPATMNINDLDGNNGFMIHGIQPYYQCGQMISGIGDINGDGKNDMLIECTNIYNDEGRIYIIFGQ